MGAGVASDFIQWNDMRMIEARDSLSFGLEPFEGIATREGGTVEGFEGDDTIEPTLTGTVDDTGAAPADFTEEFVIAQVRGNLSKHVVRRELLGHIIEGRVQDTGRATAPGMATWKWALALATDFHAGRIGWSCGFVEGHPIEEYFGNGSGR